MCPYNPDRSVVHAFSSSPFLTEPVLPYGICEMPVLIQMVYIFSYLTIQNTFEARIEKDFPILPHFAFAFGEGFRYRQQWKRIFVGVQLVELESQVHTTSHWKY